MTTVTSSKTFAEFFAGIGLVQLGLDPGGWHCAYANDIDDKKRRMYEDHFGPSAHYHVEDIWKTAEIERRLSEAPFLATASFPCIDLSLAGHWRGFDGEHSSTYFGFVEVLRRLDPPPSLIMLENVYGFLTSRKGEDFRRAILKLADMGYWMDAIVLDAKWFVPQSRPRTFVFGYHESLALPHLVCQPRGFSLDPAWQQLIDQSGALRPATLRELMNDFDLPTGWVASDLTPPAQSPYDLKDFIDLDVEQDWWTDEEVEKHYGMMEAPSRGRVDTLIANRSTAVGTGFRRTRRGKTRLEVRFDMAGCLRTPKGGSAKQVIVAISNGDLRMRWMSAREYARLQGAPNFTIHAPRIQAMHGFGDAVCVPAISWIDKHILTPAYEAATSEVTASSSN